jgi:hypothetical protein
VAFTITAKPGRAADNGARGDQHWRARYENVTRHQAAATVIGRRAHGFRARRRKGVTRTRPEDRGVRATNQAAPEHQRVTNSCHRPGTRGAKSRAPNRARTQLKGRATVTRQRPTTANFTSNGRGLRFPRPGAGRHARRIVRRRPVRRVQGERPRPPRRGSTSTATYGSSRLRCQRIGGSPTDGPERLRRAPRAQRRRRPDARTS